MNELSEGPKQQHLSDIDSTYILNTEQNYSSKSNTTNSSSSSNSLTFNEDEEDDIYCQNNEEDKDQKEEFLRGPTTSSSTNSINNHIISNSQLIISLTSSLIRTDPSSSSSSTTSSSNDQNEAILHTETNKYIFLLDAYVNGFAQLKLSADKIDYEYIIEIYWSNETKSYVKRTYEDFCTFHRHLTQFFSQFFEKNGKNVNISKLPKTKSKNNNSINRNIGFKNEYIMPVLPPSKKSFWVSHLKHAESREIELDSYVQRLLKLPTKITHSHLVLKFFESQSSDPKPAKIYFQSEPKDNTIEHFNQNYSKNQEISLSNTRINFTEDLDNNSNFEYEDEIDEDGQYLNSFEMSQNYNNLPISNSLIGLSHHNIEKNREKEAGLWWDEDEALNELTSSMSFDFGGSHNIYNKINFDENNIEELETYQTLEKILNKSELFDNTKENISVPSASSTVLKFNDNQIVNKRLSLS